MIPKLPTNTAQIQELFYITFVLQTVAHAKKKMNTIQGSNEARLL